VFKTILVFLMFFNDLYKILLKRRQLLSILNVNIFSQNTLGSNSSTRVGDKDGSAQSIGVIHNDSRLGIPFYLDCIM